MILSCPQCEVRFLVPSTTFSNGERKVRCSKCEHVWAQEEPLDRGDGIYRPIESDDQDLENQSNNIINKTMNWFKIEIIEGKKPFSIGFAVVLLLFFLYQMMMTTLIMGQGLAFNDVVVERNDNGGVNVTGVIVNAMNEDRGVPLIKISTIYEGGIKGDVVLFSPEKDILTAGESVNFSKTITNISSDIIDLKITFKLDDYKNHNEQVSHDENPNPQHQEESKQPDH